MKIVKVTRDQMEEMKEKGFEEALKELAGESFNDVECEESSKDPFEEMVEDLGLNEILSINITMNGEGFNITCGGSRAMRGYLNDNISGASELIDKYGFKMGDVAQEFVRELMLLMNKACEENEGTDEEK
jgi:hypothetical protein